MITQFNEFINEDFNIDDDNFEYDENDIEDLVSWIKSFNNLKEDKEYDKAKKTEISNFPMKHLKLFEDIPTNMYIIVRNMKTMSKYFVIRTNNFKMRDGMLVKVIYPEESSNFKIYDTEIYNNEYEDENNQIWQFFYKTTDFKDACDICDIYNETIKYNL